MHLHECLDLAFSHPAAADALALDVDPAAPEGELSFLADTLPVPSQADTQQNHAKGSILSVVQCIALEWGTKAQTNFYIPQERYAGYSYLYDDDKQPGWHTLENNYPQSTHHHTHSHLHEHRHPAFVYAENPNNLHPHHYDVYVHGAGHPSVNLTSGMTSNSAFTPLHHFHTPSILTSQSSINTNIHHAPMTMPYIHPNLELPVPPLHLPWYFGVLCWSFSFGGAMMIKLTPKWVLRGGGRVGREQEEYRGHWFPYHAYAWMLILCQSPCSFLADYVHMTNISAWHTIDRFLACALMSLELMKLLVMRRYTRPIIYILNLAFCGLALFCFFNSQKSQQALDEEGFVFWHCGWHCYPITGSFCFVIDHILNQRWGDYYSFEPETDRKENECAKRGESGGILLSTIAMNEMNNLREKCSKNQPDTSFDDVAIHTTKRAESVTTTNGMKSPLRRSRRIAGQKPEIQHSF